MIWYESIVIYDKYYSIIVVNEQKQDSTANLLYHILFPYAPKDGRYQKMIEWYSCYNSLSCNEIEIKSCALIISR